MSVVSCFLLRTRTQAAARCGRLGVEGHLGPGEPQQRPWQPGAQACSDQIAPKVRSSDVCLPDLLRPDAQLIFSFCTDWSSPHYFWCSLTFRGFSFGQMLVSTYFP